MQRRDREGRDAGGARVRPARAEDAAALVELVRELVTYERAADQVRLTPEPLATALFGPDPEAFAHVATVDGEVLDLAQGAEPQDQWTTFRLSGVALERLASVGEPTR